MQCPHSEYHALHQKSIVFLCSFTWVLYERGELERYFEGDDVPGYALYTATWGLIVPDLAEAYPGNRKMGVQVMPHKNPS